MTHERTVLVVYTHPTGNFTWFRHAMAFRDSYLVHPAELPHSLLIAYKEREGAPELFAEIADRSAIMTAVFPAAGYDISVVQRVCAQVADTVDVVVFLGAYSRILADGWLQKLVRAMDDDGIGIAGATGSYECGLGETPYNPHIRTTAFAVRPRDLVRLNLVEPLAETKTDCHLFEHGPRGLYARFIEDGSTGVVVGKEGIFEESRWEESRTFRAGSQDNLLVADNHTDAFAFGTESFRSQVRLLAWSQPKHGRAKTLSKAVRD